jgi:hypothetical protein
MGAVRAPGQLEDHGTVDQAIEERCRQRWVAQVVGPGGEVDVRRQGCRTPARAGVGQAVIETVTSISNIQLMINILYTNSENNQSAIKYGNPA